jgi:hypothetical protein
LILLTNPFTVVVQEPSVEVKFTSVPFIVIVNLSPASAVPQIVTTLLCATAGLLVLLASIVKSVPAVLEVIVT